MLDFIIKGGVVMIPILLGSVIALAIGIERMFNLTSRKVHPSQLVDKIKSLVREGNTSEALTICASNSSPIARIIEAGILKHKASRDQIKEAIEHMGRQEAAKLHKYLGALSTIASVEPSLGLLGTVTGMIRAFYVISLYGAGTPSALAGGISEALITTAAGLIIGIPALVLHNYFYKKANRLILEMEFTSMEVLDLLEATNKA